MKKIVALLLSLVMVLSMVACGANKDTDADQKAQTDMEYVKEKGKLVVGITDFAPMDYQDEKTGEWIGFDADMAKAFAEYLGVDVEFKVIVWKNKLLELDGKTVDCIWNGMTLTDEVKAAMDYKAYCNNHQVVVVKADKAEQYTTEESVKDLNFAVEQGSAGAAEAKERGWKNINEVPDQASALNEVKAGASEAAGAATATAAAADTPNSSSTALTNSDNSKTVSSFKVSIIAVIFSFAIFFFLQIFFIIIFVFL